MEWKIGQAIVHRNGAECVFTDAHMLYGQAAYEQEGWRAAESPAAPVERVLAPGWTRGHVPCCTARHRKSCGTSGGHSGKYFYSGLGYGGTWPMRGDGACEASAEAVGVFATPAPTVTVVVDECSEAEYRMTGTNSDWVKWTAKPAPKPAPRCKRFDCDRTDDRIAMRFSTKGSAAEPVCQKCHLDTEQRIAHAEEAYREIRKWDADNRPRATVGVVPQVFGLSVGILSRGMAR